MRGVGNMCVRACRTVERSTSSLALCCGVRAPQYDFDPLDVTKIWPEDIFPLQPVGRLVLNRNVDNFFAENEQLAFCPANIVPGKLPLGVAVTRSNASLIAAAPGSSGWCWPEFHEEALARWL